MKPHPANDNWRACLPGTAPDAAGLAKRLAAAPLKPAKPQAACDIGLFSDTAAQTDLVDLAKRGTNV